MGLGHTSVADHYLLELQRRYLPLITDESFVGYIIRKFNVLASVFYDDFPVVEYGELCNGTAVLLNTLLDLLGWQHAIVGKKATPFGAKMAVLGVEFDLSTISRGTFKVQNKAGRIERIIKMLRECGETGKISNHDNHDISVLQGLMNFAGRFFMGRAVKFPTYLLSNYEKWRYNKSQVAAVIDSTCTMLETLKPRIVSCFEITAPIVIYTDAAFEKDVATWGAILLMRPWYQHGSLLQVNRSYHKLKLTLSWSFVIVIDL